MHNRSYKRKVFVYFILIVLHVCNESIRMEKLCKDMLVSACPSTHQLFISSSTQHLLHNTCLENTSHTALKQNCRPGHFNPHSTFPVFFLLFFPNSFFSVLKPVKALAGRCSSKSEHFAYTCTSAKTEDSLMIVNCMSSPLPSEKHT